MKDGDKTLEELKAERDRALMHVVGTSYWTQRVKELNAEIERRERNRELCKKEMTGRLSTKHLKR